jgi:hypothetical protein
MGACRCSYMHVCAVRASTVYMYMHQCDLGALAHNDISCYFFVMGKNAPAPLRTAPAPLCDEEACRTSGDGDPRGPSAHTPRARGDHPGRSGGPDTLLAKSVCDTIYK